MKNTSYKYGAHQFLWVEHWTDESLYILDEARELGLDCFEISLGDDIAFNPIPVHNRIISKFLNQFNIGIIYSFSQYMAFGKFKVDSFFKIV